MTTSTNKITPQQSSDTHSQHSKHSKRTPSAALKAPNVKDVPTSTQEQEENSMEELARLEKRMKMSKVVAGMRSLKCLMFVGVLALIIGALCVSFVWFAVFLSTMIRFGDSVRENTFQQLRSNVQAEIHRMTVAAVAISSATTSFEPTTPMDIMRDVMLTSVISLVDQFQLVGVSLYPMNNQGAFLVSNTFNPATPDVISGMAEFSAVGDPMGLQQEFYHNLTTGTTLYLPKIPPLFSIKMPADFVQHVMDMGHPRPVAFTKPVPTFCMQDASMPGFEDGMCSLNLFKVWSHQMYQNASLGVHSSIMLITSIDALSEKLTQSTRADSMSYILTLDSKIIAASRGLDRIKENEKKWRLYKYNAEMPEASDLIFGTEYPDEMVSKTAVALKERYGTDFTGETSFTEEPQSLSVDGYIVDYQMIQLSSNVDESVPDFFPQGPFAFGIEIYMRRMVLVHVIPNDAFTRTSINTGIIVISLAAVASLISIVIVIVASCCINRPVQKLIRQMNSAKDLELDKIDVSRFTYFSELREIQSMFFFLVLNLKQYQSFLPAHVLQMIEARRLSHTDKRKSKKKQRHDAKPKITTVEDELRSESSQDDHSQTRSFFGSVKSASRMSKSDRLSHQFTLGMFRRNITVIRVHIVNMRSMLRRVSLEDIVNQHSQLVDVISKLVNVTHSATLSSFTQESFFIALNATISSSDHAKRAARLAVHLKRRIHLLNERLVQHALEPFEIVISISSGESIVSTLGTSVQKQQVIFDRTVDHAKTQTKVTTLLLNSGIIKTLDQDSGGVTVVLDQSTMSGLPKKHIQARIIDVIAMKRTFESDEDSGRWKFHYLFELQDINMEGAKAQEWMYSLKDEISEERVSERNQRMTKAWTLLVADQAQEATHLLSKLSEGTNHESFEYREMEVSSSNHETKMSLTNDVLHNRLVALTQLVSTECAGSLVNYCEERLQSMQFSKDQMWASLVSSVEADENEN